MALTSDVKTFGEELVGSKVKVLWPKDNKFYEGVGASYELSGKKNLVVYTSGVQEILKKEPLEIIPSDQEKTCTAANASSSIIPEMATGVKNHGEELVGCRVKVLWPKDKRCREGVVASYDPAVKKHHVVYANGVGEMLNLRKEQEGTTNQEAGDPASAYMIGDGVMNSHWHARKKHKGQSLELLTPPKMSEDQKDEKLEKHTQADNEIVDFKGYKVKSTNVSILESIFAKHGDIAANCQYKSTAVRASLLEIISGVVKKLVSYNIEDILIELKVLEDEVSDVESAKIDVLWLREYLTKIREFGARNEKAVLLRKAKDDSRLVLRASKKEMKKRHAELVAAQERFKEAEKQVNAIKLVGKTIDADVEEAEAEEYFWRRQLDGVL